MATRPLGSQPQPPSSGCSTAGLGGAPSDHLAHVLGEEGDWTLDPDVLADTVAHDDGDQLGSDCDDIADDSESSSECEIFAPTTEAARCGLYYIGNPY